MDENGVLDINMRLSFNGKERSNSNYQTLYHTHPTTGKKQAWSFPRIIAWLGQQNIAMQEGYILGSGTIGNGCIAEFSAKMNPQTNEVIEPATYPWLADGDIVTMEAEGIGKLENKVRLAAKQLAQAK
jgi:2-keto-4-pentenoate hydratase/2-oxohepta-3-ene-1,7-dioic acid hydratase in catechol pathway